MIITDLNKFFGESILEKYINPNLEYYNYNITTDTDSTTVKLILPGVEKENIDLSVNDGILSIKINDKKQSIILPKNLDISSVTSTHKNGVVTLMFKKKEDKSILKIKL